MLLLAPPTSPIGAMRIRLTLAPRAGKLERAYRSMGSSDGGSSPPGTPRPRRTCLSRRRGATNLFGGRRRRSALVSFVGSERLLALGHPGIAAPGTEWGARPAGRRLSDEAPTSMVCAPAEAARAPCVLLLDDGAEILPPCASEASSRPWSRPST